MKKRAVIGRFVAYLSDFYVREGYDVDVLATAMRRPESKDNVETTKMLNQVRDMLLGSAYSLCTCSDKTDVICPECEVCDPSELCAPPLSDEEQPPRHFEAPALQYYGGEERPRRDIFGKLISYST